MGNDGSLKSKNFKGAIWDALERFSVQGISFVVMIIMARILTPADIGLVGMVLIFIHITKTLIDAGSYLYRFHGIGDMAGGNLYREIILLNS